MSNMTKLPVQTLLKQLHTLRNMPKLNAKGLKRLLKIESHLAMRGANPDYIPKYIRYGRA